MSARLEAWGISGLPEIVEGTDLGALLSGAGLQDGDVVVVTSKVVSKAEGQLVPGTRDEHLAGQTRRVVARRGDTQIVETHHGLVLAAAGIDASNVPTGMVALLPVDPDASAAAIRESVRRHCGVEVAVIVSDTMGRPWREGLTDTAIGAAGLDVLWDLRGKTDDAGHVLEATVIAVADELAAAGDLVKGKLAATPVAVVRGFPYTQTAADQGAKPLIRNASDDLFRLGTRDAVTDVVARSAPVDGPVESNRNIDDGAVRRAVDAIGPVPVDLVVTADGRSVTATGDPVGVGYALGRLMAALAAEGLRATAPTPTPNGATITVTNDVTSLGDIP
jgi:coenzyme F420-0:L-glutamate ligase/coenzyme F420-1:gamma-L-glutamate ligase